MEARHESYTSNTINAFTGLNLNVAPTLLDLPEARQLLNLRIEKAGKLVSRNGYFYGVFINTKDAANQSANGFDPTYIPLSTLYLDNRLNKITDFSTIDRITCGYPYSAGVLGISEFKLAEFWNEIDTDRLLVVAIRHPYISYRGNTVASPAISQETITEIQNAVNKQIAGGDSAITDDDIKTTRGISNLMEFLFVPLTGKYRNVVIDPYYLFSGNKLASYSQFGSAAFDQTWKLGNNYIYPGFTREQSSQSIGRQWVLQFAPNRLVPYNQYLYNSGELLHSWNLLVWEERFDRQFIKMNQYRNYLVISDPINGDVNITDDYDWQEDKCGEKYHRLRIAPNCLESFDINIVEIDLRFDQENNIEEGVEWGLGLYKFKLPLKYTKINVDGFDPALTDASFLMSDVFNNAGMSESQKNNAKWIRELRVMDYMWHQRGTTLLTAVGRSIYGKTGNSLLPNEWITPYIININNRIHRIFSNTNDLVQFNDILAEVELEDDYENIKKEDEVIQKEKIKGANVFVWDEYKIRYFPTKGVTGDNIILPYLLREIDRFFGKSHTGAPRIMQINPKKEPGKYAPLGIWQYKFVWDFGNGVFSAPSTTLNVPDIMWSATKDSEMIRRDNSQYSRFYNQNKVTGLRMNANFLPIAPTDTDLGLPYFNPALHTDVLQPLDNDTTISFWKAHNLDNLALYRTVLFEGLTTQQGGNWNIRLSRVGQIVWELKHKLYEKVGNRYGDTGYYYTQNINATINEAANVDLMSIIDFYTMITCFFSATDVGTKGFAWQFVKLDAEKWSDGDSYSGMVSDELKADIGPLVIPIFRHEDAPPSTLSLCDDDGRLRLTWLAPNYYKVIIDGQERFQYMPNKCFTYPFVFDYTRGSTLPIPRYATILREPFYPFMQMYIMFYSNMDFNNLPRKYFEPTSSGTPLLYSTQILKSNVNNTSIYIDNARDFYNKYYVLRPTAPIRVLPKENAPYRLSNLSSEIPNEVADRLVLQGVIELKVVDKNEYLINWGFANNWKSSELPPLFIPFISLRRYDGTNLNPNMTLARSVDNKHFWEDIGTGGMPNIYWLEGNWDNGKGFNITSPFLQYTTATGDPILTLAYYPYIPSDPSQLPPMLEMTVAQVIQSPYVNYHTIVPLSGWGTYLSNAMLHNIDVYLYGQAERLVLLEQLTAHFPSSLLFKAPRVALRIKENDVPQKAKKLLIFRTRSTNNNYYNPDEFGFVAEVEIYRDQNGISTITKNPDGSTEIHQGEIYYFDKIADDLLDFGHTPDAYEGLRRPIKSRFNLPLNERVYYYNFIEEYQPERPRDSKPIRYTSVESTGGGLLGQVKSYNDLPLIAVVDSSSGYSADGITLSYLLVYSDSQNILSQPTQVVSVVVHASPTQKKAVVLYLQPTRYNPTIKVKVYRKRNNEASFYYIGEIRPGDEGIFVDDELPDKEEITCVDPVVMDYPTGLRWSRPYRPDWIEEDAFTEYKGGNIGTGLEENYGNLVLFSDSSIARYTVQAENPPISRIDELTPEYGCIAPNSVLNIDNTLFFLTWKGFMGYNNNIFKLVDEKFNNELVNVIKVNPTKYIRDITAGSNPMYNEIYLNTPLLLSHNPFFVFPKIFDEKVSPKEGNQINELIVTQQSRLYYEFGDIVKHEHYRLIFGNIYVLNHTLPYVTKFGYINTLRAKSSAQVFPLQYYKMTTSPIEALRLYYVDSLGEMRSGDIYPNTYVAINPYNSVSPYADYYWAGLYIETPTKTEVLGQPLYRRLQYSAITGFYELSLESINYTDEDVYPRPPRILPDDNNQYYYSFKDHIADTIHIFPVPFFAPVKWIYYSKFFSDQNETNLKRIRKVLINLFSRGNFSVNIQTLRLQENDSNIEDYNLTGLAFYNWFNFEPNEEFYDELRNQLHIARPNNCISVTPIVKYYSTTGMVPSLPNNINDWNVKPTKSSVELYGHKYVQINEIELIWRQIHKYLL